MTCEQLILLFLDKETYHAVHEIQFAGHSDTAVSARLRELRNRGYVEGRRREGKAFKEWRLTK